MGGAYISRVICKNFKSFKKIDVNLIHGFQVFMGPNGSGKSNICDAIRFGIGEHKMSALRAKTIRDLINHDSKFAEVSIEVTTPDGKHEITRKIDREGNSTYILNGKKTTRTNIVELLKRYNIENGAHNVIGQGEVQRIVEMSATERRKIIEEIAGISEFEEKKKEALKELDLVQDRINNTKIILNEKEGNLKQLKKEKEEAEEYLKLKTRIKNLRNSILKIRIKDTEDKLNQILKEYSELKFKIADIDKEIEGITARIKLKSDDANRISKEINEKTANNSLYQRYENLERELAVLREKTENLKNERERAIKFKKEDLNRKKMEISERIRDVEEYLSSKKQTLDTLNNEIEEIKRRIDMARKRDSTLVNESMKISNEIKEMEKQLENQQREYLDIQGEISRIKSLISAKEIELQDLGGVDETAEIHSIREIEKEIKNLEKERDKFKKERENLFNRERKINERLRNVDSELLKAKNEFSKYKSVLTHVKSENVINFIRKLRDEGKVQGIHGTIEELCSFDSKYATAIEAAVGGRLNYIVVDNLDVARELVEILRRNKIGKTTFLPLKMNLPPAQNKPLNFPGVMGKLLDFINFDAVYSDPMRYAFGETVLITDIETAKDVGLVGKARLVTIEGDLIERSSAVTGGYHVSGMRLAERKKAVELEKKVSMLQIEKESLMEELYGIREKAAKIRQELAEYDNKIREKRTDIEILMKRGEEVKKRLDRAKEAKDQIIKLKKELKDKEANHEKVSKAIARIREKLEKLRTRKEDIDRVLFEKNSADQEKLSKMMEEYSKLETEYQSKLTENNMLKENLQEIEKDIQKLIEEDKRIESEILNAENKTKEITLEREKLKGELEIANREIKELITKRDQIQREVDELSQRRGELNGKKESYIRKQYSLEKDKAIYEQKIVDYKGEFQDEDFEFIEEDLHKMERELSQLQNRIAPLEGIVNLRALTIYDQKKAEIEEIKLKLEKLENERESVINMIKEVDKRKLEVFMEAFNKVNESFKNLFKQTFKRGEGELVLLNPEDPFSGGMDVKVNFTGKRPERIEALSGGQKSIIGLLLVFALHMYKPSAFYILDEVEAALDKANSRYVAELVTQLSKHTQFVVVSHNDTVISSADTVMGVTKSKNGSIIVGIKLNESPKQEMTIKANNG